ncbi:hypothetical protein O974_10060 [Mycobacterium avium 11-0986]|nr:hypothetical protein O974_10060 [Mycobacterium avium 11-0986]
MLGRAPLEPRDQGVVVRVAQHDVQVDAEPVGKLPQLGALTRIAERRVDDHAVAAAQPTGGVAA